MQCRVSVDAWDAVFDIGDHGGSASVLSVLCCCPWCRLGNDGGGAFGG